jgi:hypothetical protein
MIRNFQKILNEKTPFVSEEGLVLELLFTPTKTNCSEGDFTNEITNCFHMNLFSYK